MLAAIVNPNHSHVRHHNCFLQRPQRERQVLLRNRNWYLSFLLSLHWLPMQPQNTTPYVLVHAHSRRVFLREPLERMCCIKAWNNIGSAHIAPPILRNRIAFLDVEWHPPASSRLWRSARSVYGCAPEWFVTPDSKWVLRATTIA